MERDRETSPVLFSLPVELADELYHPRFGLTSLDRYFSKCVSNEYSQFFRHIKLTDEEKRRYYFFGERELYFDCVLFGYTRKAGYSLEEFLLKENPFLSIPRRRMFASAVTHGNVELVEEYYSPDYFYSANIPRHLTDRVPIFAVSIGRAAALNDNRQVLTKLLSLNIPKVTSGVLIGAAAKGDFKLFLSTLETASEPPQIQPFISVNLQFDVLGSILENDNLDFLLQLWKQWENLEERHRVALEELSRDYFLTSTERIMLLAQLKPRKILEYVIQQHLSSEFDGFYAKHEGEMRVYLDFAAASGLQPQTVEVLRELAKLRFGGNDFPSIQSNSTIVACSAEDEIIPRTRKYFTNWALLPEMERLSLLKDSTPSDLSWALRRKYIKITGDDDEVFSRKVFDNRHPNEGLNFKAIVKYGDAKGSPLLQSYFVRRINSTVTFFEALNYFEAYHPEAKITSESFELNRISPSLETHDPPKLSSFFDMKTEWDPILEKSVSFFDAESRGYWLKAFKHFDEPLKIEAFMTLLKRYYEPLNVEENTPKKMKMLEWLKKLLGLISERFYDDIFYNLLVKESLEVFRAFEILVDEKQRNSFAYVSLRLESEGNQEMLRRLQERGYPLPPSSRATYYPALMSPNQLVLASDQAGLESEDESESHKDICGEVAGVGSTAGISIETYIDDDIEYFDFAQENFDDEDDEDKMLVDD